MTEDFENIDNIYSETFINYKPEATEEEWQKLSARLQRQNFMKFGIAHFNIYYVVLFTVITGLSIYVSNRKPGASVFPKEENNLKKELLPSNSTEIQTIHNQSTNTKKTELLNYVLKKEENTKPSIGIGNNAKEINKSNSDLTGKNNKSADITNMSSSEQKNDTVPALNQISTVNTEKKKIKKITVVVKNPVMISDSVVEYKKGK